MIVCVLCFRNLQFQQRNDCHTLSRDIAHDIAHCMD